MPLPDYQSLMQPDLHVLNDDEEHKRVATTLGQMRMALPIRISIRCANRLLESARIDDRRD